MPSHLNAGQVMMKVAKRSSKNVKFKYLGTTVTNQNLIHDKINPSAWRFKFRCRVSPAVLFSAWHLNSD
jgi:hypothetical protein